MRLHIDLETRSAENLKLTGQYKYAEHPTTQVILASWAIDDEPPNQWFILQGEPASNRFIDAVLNPETRFIAHVASFERILLTVVGHRQNFLPKHAWNELRRIERWSCTANRAAACGLPRALENTAHALRLQHQKDKEGQALMRSMCAPAGVDDRGRYVWLENQKSMQRLMDYCVIDVEVEREADRLLPELSPFEQRVAWTTERMNDRGIHADRDFLIKMRDLTRGVTDDLNRRVIKLTNGWVPRITNPQAITAWIRRDYGLDLENGIRRWVIDDLLDDEGMDPLLREVLVMRRDGGRSSVSKLMAIENRLNQDDRIRGALIYGGATATLRYSSHGAQLHNLPRGKTVKKPHLAVKAIKTGLMTPAVLSKEFGPPMVVASELIRPLFGGRKGCWLARGDYSQIEARVTAWLAGHQKRLHMFHKYDAGDGPDVYVTSYADAMGVSYDSVPKEGRQAGKCFELAFGFLGGRGALDSAERLYNITVPGDKDAIVAKWRESNQPTVQLGNDMIAGALRCMRQPPGQVIQIRSNVAFKRNDTVMQMRIPSGRAITYWYPEIIKTETPWGEQRDTIQYSADDKGKWSVHKMWRGLLVENAVQATARDFMAYALVELDERGLNPLLSVHDEAICELPKTKFPQAEEAAEAVKEVMLISPPWGIGVPLAADASADDRYIKS